MRDNILYSIIFGFIAGILTRSFWQIGMPVIYFIVFLSVISLIYYFLVSRKAKAVLVLSLFLFAGALGIWRFEINVQNVGDPALEKSLGQKVEISGMIDDEPSIKPENIAITVRINEVQGQKVMSDVEVLATVKSGQKYSYGDMVKISGVIKKPENFITDQGKTFDYVHYLQKDGIFYVSSYPFVEIISHGGGSFIKRGLFAAKENFIAKINAVIPTPESTLMGGLILGEKSSFSQEFRQAFVNTGTIHIIALSGYNVTIVADWVMKLLAFLPRTIAFGGGIFSIILFVVMTGGQSTAIRAGAMASLALVARASGRKYPVGRVLILVGALMILINPLLLAFDASFQLSFLATIAVIYFVPIIERYFLWIKWKLLREVASVTTAAYVFVMPFILYVMGNLSIVALPANIAILPFIQPTMILGFATGFVGFISSTLSFLPGHLAYYLLHYELGAINFFSKLHFASIAISNFPLWLTIFVYVIFAYILSVFWDETKQEEKAVLAPNMPEKNIPSFTFKYRLLFVFSPFLITLVAAAIIYYPSYQSLKASKENLQALLVSAPLLNPAEPFVADPRTKSSGCVVAGALPDHECSPGAIFTDATVEKICVPGYTKRVRNVPTSLRKKVFAEYGIALPVPFGSYENDHIIALELGGSNDIANLFPELASPAPGFHEKDVVENYLHQEVCEGRVALSVAQKQISTDWLAVYDNLSPEEITVLKHKFRGWTGN